MENKNQQSAEKNFTGTDLGQLDAIITKIEEKSKDPQTLKDLTKAAITVDQSAPIRYFRKFWDRLPELAQCAMMHITKGPFIMSSNGPIQIMMKFGLINYKGHLNEKGEVMDAKIQAMGGPTKLLKRYGVKIGKYFIPELKAIEPMVEQIAKYEDRLDKVSLAIMPKVRESVRTNRLKVEGPAININLQQGDTRAKVADTINLYPQAV